MEGGGGGVSKTVIYLTNVIKTLKMFECHRTENSASVEERL